ncbi:hypothetical protein T02_251 [Trichinella nativa]|uniref:Uncharacterized protein n=1 Tax=Trichinella nativa TaxID=6335 RepID=A0A0V1KL54_9BILA|nr:hypothetical protein T02_15640 [Trichinella nativa]KRZ47605.1 hypothetical protein T02_14648 [Trichinella nativa]KRZ47879.1 hypothetical protein T02_251 [Trichinella nativa]
MPVIQNPNIVDVHLPFDQNPSQPATLESPVLMFETDTEHLTRSQRNHQCRKWMKKYAVRRRKYVLHYVA